MNLSNIFDINRKSLSFFGWLAIAIAILSIPYLSVSFFIGFTNPNSASEPHVFTSLFSILYVLVSISIFYFFKVLLNKKYKFFKADRPLSMFIYLNLLFTVFTEAISFVPGTETINIIITFASLIPLGIISIALGIKLMSLEDRLFGIKKSLSINMIASGVLLSSVILFLFAIIPALIVDVLLGVIFLRESANFSKASK